MNDVTGWAAVGSAIVSNIGLWLKIVYDKKNGNNNTNNSGKGPGKAQVCIKRGEDLAVIKNQIVGFDKDFEEIKESLKNIDSKI